MPKISSLNVKSVIIKFIVKSLALTTTSIILISSVASFIIFKLDLDLSYCKYGGYLISALTSFIVPFICLKPFKNNILFLSFLSIIPLVLFTLANFIFFGKEFVQLFISLAIIIAVAFVTGVMSAGKRRWLKLSDIPIELKKEFNLEDENEKKTDIEKIIVDNKTVIYSIVFYACSLAIGTVLYRLLQSSALDSVLKPSNANFSKLFSQNICNYLSLFLITVFLAFCLIGYGLINIIPCIIGIQVGMKAAYFYINYQAKGVGYTILMIAPFAALFLTVLIFVIQTSSNMSKQIVDLTKNNLDYKLEVKPTLRKFLIYGLIIIAFSGVCALIETLLKSVVTI